jgi:hypothetical protein
VRPFRLVHDDPSSDLYVAAARAAQRYARRPDLRRRLRRPS